MVRGLEMPFYICIWYLNYFLRGTDIFWNFVYQLLPDQYFFLIWFCLYWQRGVLNYRRPVDVQPVLLDPEYVIQVSGLELDQYFKTYFYSLVSNSAHCLDWNHWIYIFKPYLMLNFEAGDTENKVVLQNDGFSNYLVLIQRIVVLHRLEDRFYL